MAELTLRSRTDSDLGHVEIGRLLDREGHGTGNGTPRDNDLRSSNFLAFDEQATVR